MPKITSTPSPKRLRLTLGFDQRDWAHILGVSTRTVERWDAGVEPTGLACEVFRGINQAIEEGVAIDVIRIRLSLGLGAFIHGFLTGSGVRKRA